MKGNDKHMPIKFINDEVPPIERVITGFPSFDLALSDGRGNIGYPLRTLTEIFGPSGIGKSTLMFSLAAIISTELGKKKLDFADFEGQSRDTLENALTLNGFEGEIDVLRNTKNNTHEKMMDAMIADVESGKCDVSMLDSIGAFSPISELEGSVADANMGQKARIVGNWSRGMINAILTRKTPATALYVSHQHSNIGFIGSHTSGGETKNFLNGIKIKLRKMEDYEGGWVLDGKIEKNRYGKPGTHFYVFIIGGVGAHKGLSAVFDCYYNKLATIERKVIHLGDKSYGKIPAMIANMNDAEMFQPFFDALQGAEPVADEEEDSGE